MIPVPYSVLGSGFMRLNIYVPGGYRRLETHSECVAWAVEVKALSLFVFIGILYIDLSAA